MTYDEWADEYLKSAKSTELKIKECERKMKGCRNTRLLFVYRKKLDVLCDMYDDCMYTAGVLRRRADSLRRRGLDKLITV